MILLFLCGVPILVVLDIAFKRFGIFEGLISNLTAAQWHSSSSRPQGALRSCDPTDPFPFPFLLAARSDQIQLPGGLLPAAEVR